MLKLNIVITQFWCTGFKAMLKQYLLQLFKKTKLLSVRGSKKQDPKRKF